MPTEQQEAALNETIERIRRRSTAARIVRKADRVSIDNYPGAQGQDAIKRWVARGRAAAQLIIELDPDQLTTLVTLGLRVVAVEAKDIDEAEADIDILAERYVAGGGS